MSDLPDEVRRSLRRQADRIEVADIPFDPDAPRSIEVGETGTGPSPRSPHPAWRWGAVAAAAALVVALATGAVTIGIGDPGGDEATTAEETESPFAEPIPEDVGDAGPGWLPVVPEGLGVWSVDWGTTTLEQPPLAQLFESRTSAARLLVVVRPGGRPEGEPDLDVRGQPARIGALPGDPEVTTYTWAEGGAELTAMTRDLAQADAVAFLDGLAWRTSAPAGGFANPTGGLLDLAAEAEGGLVEVRTTTVVLADDPAGLGADDGGDRRAITVTIGAPVDDDRLTVDAVEDRFAGEVDADGTITHDDGAGTYRRTEPNGTWVEVRGRGEDDLAAVVDGVVATDAEELYALRSEVEMRIADEITVDARIEVEDADGQPDATVELRTVGEAAAVCLVLDGASRRCSGVEDRAAGVIGSFLVDDRWWLAVVDRSAVTISDSDSDGDGDVREGSEGGYDAALLAVPDDVDVVRAGPEGDEREVRRPSI